MVSPVGVHRQVQGKPMSALRLSLFVAAMATCGPARATDFSIQNTSDKPILVWFKLGHERDWGKSIPLQPQEQKTWTLSGRGTIDVWTRYFTNESQTEMEDRAVSGVNIEPLADSSRSDDRTWTISISARVKREWEKRGNDWMSLRPRGWSCEWTFYARNGHVMLGLPQDSGIGSMPPAGAYDPPRPPRKPPKKNSRPTR